jgi:hypothetical protein
MEITEADIKENPQDWERSIIHPSLLHDLNKNVKEILEDWKATTEQDEQRYELKHS